MKEYDGYKITFSGSHGYPTIHVNGKNVLLHRYVWMKHNGEIPEGYQVHHKDRNRLNYDITNLELIKSGEHQRIHAIENGLGKSNKGKPKHHQSGCVPKARKVKLIKGNQTMIFESISDAARFLKLKSASSIVNVLSGYRKSAKGWCASYD